MASRKFHTGWILCKPKFQGSYETKRLIEEFHKQDINVTIVDPNEIRDNPLNLVEQFELLQRNRYREMSNVLEFTELNKKLLFTIVEQFKEMKVTGIPEFNLVNFKIRRYLKDERWILRKIKDIKMLLL